MLFTIVIWFTLYHLKNNKNIITKTSDIIIKIELTTVDIKDASVMIALVK